ATTPGARWARSPADSGSEGSATAGATPPGAAMTAWLVVVVSPAPPDGARRGRAEVLPPGCGWELLAGCGRPVAGISASCVAVVLGMIVGAAGFELLGAEAPAVPEPGWWGLAVPAPLVPAPPPCDPGPAAAPASAFFGWGPAAAGFPACCGPRCHS